MTSERALFIIDELLNEWFPPPTSYMAKNVIFRMMSYQNWAVKELRDYVYQHKKDSIMDTIEDFREKLAAGASRAKNSEVNFIFCTAYDAVSCILDVLRNGSE